MDTGASSHMTAHPCNLHTVFNTSTTSHILVSNDSHIPVHGSGIANLTPNLSLTNVLLAPHIVKNLVSVRKFTCDNNVSVEFDPFGFSVKDLQTGGLVMRCNSYGDLYPVTKPVNLKSSTSISLVVLSPQLWHHRLGHPGDHIFRMLRNNKSITCNKKTISHLCSSCEVAKLFPHLILFIVICGHLLSLVAKVTVIILCCLRFLQLCMGLSPKI